MDNRYNVQNTSGMKKHSLTTTDNMGAILADTCTFFLLCARSVLAPHAHVTMFS